MSSILAWNDIALETQRVDYDTTAPSNAQISTPQQAGPVKTARAFAIVHLAMHEAATAFRTAGASQLDAAVAGAACQTLGALYDRQAKAIQAKAAVFVGALTGSTAANRHALYRGHVIGEKLLTARRGDGFDAPELYVPGMGPNHAAGVHVLDPLHQNQGFYGTQLGEMKPFCLKPAWKLIDYIDTYPAIGTADYTKDFTQVKDVGAWDSSSRSANQTETGIFWAYDGSNKIGTPPRLYNQCLGAIVKGKGLSEIELARLFALVNIGLADAGIVAWRAKYHFALWRPTPGIRHAATGADPAWRPLGAPSTNGMDWFATPNFPSYPSGHATFGTTFFEIVRRFFVEKNGTPGNADLQDTGAAIPFDIQSDEYKLGNAGPDGIPRSAVTRHYATLSDAIKDNILSRVYLGVHWAFDGAKFDTMGNVDYGLTAGAKKIGGAAIGYRVAKHVFESCVKT